MAPPSLGRIEDVLAPVDHSTMNERVYSQIRDAFTSGLVVPGQRIVIRKFAHSLGTSMMPVRDALRRLEAENALVALTGRNLTVPTMTSRDYEELCRIRVSLEGLAAAEAAKNITEAEIEGLSAVTEAMEVVSESQDIEATLRLNREFHFCVYAGAHRPLLLRMIESLWLRVGPQLAYAIRHDIHGGDVVDSPYHPHRQVLAALRDRDASSASLAVAYDINRAGRIIIEHLRTAEGGGAAAPTRQRASRKTRSTDGTEVMAIDS